MFSLKKLNLRYLIIIFSLFNLILLVSLIINILISIGALQEQLILSFIGDYFSTNLFITVSLLMFEGLIISYYWYKTNRNTQPLSSIENGNRNNLIELDDINNFENFNLEGGEQSTQLSEVVVPTSDENNFYSLVTKDELTYSEQTAIPQFEVIDEENNLSPNFLKVFNEDKDIIRTLHSPLEVSTNNNFPSPILSDQQLSLYRNLVKIDWLYEKKVDKDRIGFDHYTVDDSNILYSDLLKLISCGMIFKRKIHHPKGSFIVYTSNSKIEQKIVTHFVRDFLKKNNLKIHSRKISFKNWQEFGLSKESWRFDFEIIDPATVCCIWCEGDFLSLNDFGRISPEKKDVLKALIATAALKLNNGVGVLILNNEENLKIVQKFLKGVAWGELVLLDFSDKNFFESFHRVFSRKDLGF